MFTLNCPNLVKAKWTEKDTVKFAELYREHGCLWNMKDPDYKKKNVREQAIETIVQTMRLEDFGAYEAKQKIKNLRSTYKQEIQKIKKSSECGFKILYRPHVKWFHIFDYIMKSSKSSNDTTNCLDSLAEETLAVEEVHVKVEPLDSEENLLYEDTVLEQPQINPLQLNTPLLQVEQGTKRPLADEGNSINTNKRRFDDLSLAITDLQAVCRSLSSLNQPNTCAQENEAFGKYVALALNKLSQHNAILAQNEIQNILTQYRLGAACTDTSFNVCTTRSPSTSSVSQSDSSAQSGINVTSSYIIEPKYSEATDFS